MVHCLSCTLLKLAKFQIPSFNPHLTDNKMSITTKRSVLITGCSDGSLGSGLAISFHKAGFHVYATARNPSKMKDLKALGIETLTLDVLDKVSIAACVDKISDRGLDILINNAGATYPMPFSDLSLPEAKKLFDLNVWSYLEVTQAFLPLLLESKGMIVNHTSEASVLTIPFQSAYNASKAAIAVFSDTQRLELEPFGITVVDIKSGAVKSNIMNNQKDTASTASALPQNSIYAPARETLEKSLSGERFFEGAMEREDWAEFVVRRLLRKSPPKIVWMAGAQEWMVRIALCLPFNILDGILSKMTGLNVVAKLVKR